MMNGSGIFKGEGYTHDDIKFLFGLECIKNGLSVKFEVLDGDCRVDVVVFYSGKKVAYAEIKRSKRKSNSWESTRQFCKYSNKSTPTVFVDGISAIKKSVDEILKIVSGESPKINEVKELATTFDMERCRLLGIDDKIVWDGKEIKQLTLLIKNLERKFIQKTGNESVNFTLSHKISYLKRFIQISFSDSFAKDKITPSFLNSQFNAIFTKYELKNSEKPKEPDPEPVYHQRYDTSTLLTNIAQKKTA